MAEEKRIKISELPDVGESLDGFFTVGTKEIGGVLTSVKANLGFVKQAADGANEAADGANEAAERAEAAADSLKDLEPYSDDEWNEIIPPEPPKRLYTECFNGEVSPEDYANDNGYESIEEMVKNFPNAALKAGAQKFEPTGETLEYKGETYELWKMFCAQNGETASEATEWWDTGFYGMIPVGLSKETLISKSMMADVDNRYEPVFGLCTKDLDVYGTSDGSLKFCLVYVE